MIAEPERDWLLAKDEELLAEFVACRSEDAFREILRRYGPLVLSVCRRGTSHSGDAEDAFQATFLVLSQSARKVKNGKSLAAWLYGVAYRVCNRLRRENSRCKAMPLMDADVAYDDPLDELLALHDQRLTDEELARLPETLRTPLVLRYLVGKSNADVSEELGITVAAVEGRLKRAKQQLRLRLIRQGVTLAAAVAILKTTRVAAEQLPSELITQSTAACCSPTPAITTGSPTETNLPNTLALEEINLMNTIFFSKAAAALVAACGITTVVLGAQLALSQEGGTKQTGELSLAQSEHVAVANDVSEGAPRVNTLRLKSRKNNDAGDPFGSSELQLEGGKLKVAVNPTTTLEADTLVLKTSPRGQLDINPSSDFSTAHFSVEPRTESEQRIQEALASQITAPMEFVDAHLQEVVHLLQDEYSIPIELDLRALDDIGIGPEEPITINSRNVRLRSALRRLLDQLDLTYTVKDEVLLITTPDEAAVDLETRVYPIDGFDGVDEETIGDLILLVVSPDTWRDNGTGEGSLVTVPGRLVVLQTYQVHEEINKLLWQMEQTKNKETPVSKRETPSQNPFAGF